MSTALIIAVAAAFSSCVDTVGIDVPQEPAVIEVSPSAVTLEVGGAQKITGIAKDAAGAIVIGATVVWSSTDSDVASISADGTITALKTGTTRIVAAAANGVSSDATVTVQSVAPPPVGSDGEFVAFPSDEVAFIIGPQLKSGSPANPWPWFDSNATDMGHRHGGVIDRSPIFQIEGTVEVTNGSRTVRGAGTRFVTQRPSGSVGLYVINASGRPVYSEFDVVSETELTLRNAWGGESAQGLIAMFVSGTENDEFMNRHYYDLGLVQYTNYYRTGDPAFLQYARNAMDAWYDFVSIGGRDPNPSSFGVAPRNVGLAGLMLRALDGRPDMWPWIVTYARNYYSMWLGTRLDNPQLHYGVRDGGFMLLFVSQLGAVHPDANVRAEMHHNAVRAGRDYYARLNYPDGGWYWRDATVDDGTRFFAQPIMVGILLEGMIAAHRLTSDGAIANAITKSVEWLYTVGFETHETSDIAGLHWRAMAFRRYRDAPQYGLRSAVGADFNRLREARQLNAMTIHAFGYAYRLTGDPKYRVWGDDVFSATFGKQQGPGADRGWGLADFREKEYNQNYRSSGHYLAWRLN